VSSSIDLEGLLPSWELTFSYDKPKQLKFIEKFEFPQLDNKRGIFIIDFFSNGINSRAVIKKGSLSHVMKPAETCQEFFILDENNEVRKGEKTGIWTNGFFYPANA
jgi:hypothetical protein